MREETNGQTTNDAPETIRIRRDHLAQLQKLGGVGEVASSVAHEFNNILTAILNHAKLGMRNPDIAGKDQSFEKILNAAKRAGRITTGMLALSKNRSASKNLTNVVEIVEEVLAVVEKDLMKHKIRLERQFADVPKIYAVASQIEQVLLNVIINARQAMPTGGQLKVGVVFQEATQMVEISVKDSGIGIAAENLGKIFDPFFTTKDGPDSSGHGGSGLGLSVCREIIEKHAGRIRVESLIGKGSTFIIKLPIGERDDRSASAA